MIQEVTIQNNYTVYKHEAPNGKVYIGITSQEPTSRWQNGKGYRHNEYFQRAIDKYGWESMKHEVLFTRLTKAEAEDKERMLIAYFKSNQREYGYNITSGGECIGKHSAESRMKMSLAKKGCSSPRKGIHLSDETKTKISNSHKGMRYNIGVPFSEERKRKLSENHYDCSGENNPNHGKKWTPEQIAIRQSHRVYKTGGDNPTAKAIYQCTLDGEIVKKWGSISEASKEFCRTSIKDCLKGKYKQHRGYTWRYTDD